MNETINVQKFSENEWQIQGILTGNIQSKTVVILSHEGGYDKNENGLYPVIENNTIKKIDNRTVFSRKKYGNYEILTNSLNENNDVATFRYDLRNHGNSLEGDSYDRRDMLYMRYAKDLRDIVKYLKNKYDFQNFCFIGTGVGSLINEYYLTKLWDRSFIVKSVVSIAPLTPQVIYNKDPNNKFIYQKQVNILTNKKQFTGIKGIFEGPKTLYEAEENYNITSEYAHLQIPTLYILSSQDKLYPSSVILPAIEQAKEINSHAIIEILSKQHDYGATDHGFYDPDSSNMMLELVYLFLTDNLKK